MTKIHIMKLPLFQYTNSSLHLFINNFMITFAMLKKKKKKKELCLSISRAMTGLFGFPVVGCSQRQASRMSKFRVTLLFYL